MSNETSATPVIASIEETINPRRDFLKKGGAFGLATIALGLVNVQPGWARTVSSSEAGDARILNVALGLEFEAIAAYGVGAKSGLLKGQALKLALQFRGQHRAHAEALQGAIRGMGARAVGPKPVKDYHFPVNTLHNQADVLRFAAGLEKAAAMAYLGTVPEFHNRGLAKTAASIMGDETMHWAVLRDALGENPVPISFI